MVLEALKNGAQFLGLSFLNEEAVSRAGQAQDVGEDPLLASEHVARGSVGRQALHVCTLYEIQVGHGREDVPQAEALGPGKGGRLAWVPPFAVVRRAARRGTREAVEDRAPGGPASPEMSRVGRLDLSGAGWPWGRGCWSGRSGASPP